MIDLIYLRQKQRQAEAIAALARSTYSSAMYSGRDEGTGQRIVVLADGSKLAANYLGIHEVATNPLVVGNSLGLPGFIGGR